MTVNRREKKQRFRVLQESDERVEWDGMEASGIDKCAE